MAVTSALIELVFHTESDVVKQKMEEFDIPFEDGEIIISRRITNNRVINKVNDCKRHSGAPGKSCPRFCWI